MSDVSQFKLPDVGEGLTEAEIVSWKVKPGDTVKVNDVIVEIETAKSLVELPCPFAGVVEGLLVDEGTTVPVGTPIISVRTGGSGAAPPPSEEAPGAAEPKAAAKEERQAVLVGYGPRATSAKRRARKSAADHEQSQDNGRPDPDSAHDQHNGEGARTAAQPTATDVRVLAKPPVRKLARDLGVDLRSVTPTGADGVITRDDVQSAASAPAPALAPPATGGAGWDGLPREERVPIRSVRKVTAENVARSAFTAPHVTEFITVDVTRTMRLVERLRASREFRDIKLSPLAVLARAMCIAARRTPDVNARWDEAAGEIVMQRYVNLGIAAATPRGLVVPNIKDADRKSLRELAVAINDLAGTAREGKTQPAEMSGGTMSITNVGVFGVDTGTPILPPGEAAIMVFGAVKQQPWVHKGKVKPRWVTTLGLSFDHRLVDGEQGSRFLADVAALLEDPGNALVWG
jgi:2-oxoisovalerate dehydrogenase E2 component (dihydrolipoyl transacylase)